MRTFLVFAVCLLGLVLAQNCGCQTGSDEPCCSQYGYCGSSAEYCDSKNGCKENCWGSSGSGGSSGSSGNGGSSSGSSSSGSSSGNNPPSPAGTCFPLGTAKFNGNQVPNVSRSDWFCGQDQLYGFLGFSYPLEDEDCNAGSNSYDSISNDMKKMKQHGATFLRVYLTSCRQVSIWKNLVRAGRDNNMAVIGMIFWDFGPSPNKMRDSENSIISVFEDSELGKIAPYVIHSIEFNDELGEEGDWWMDPFKQFKARAAKYGIPVAISDDWDRDVWHSNTDYLNDWGKKANDAQDQTHVHVIPYFHGGDPHNIMDYLKKQVSFLQRNNMKRPHIISQTEWPSGAGEHSYRPEWDNIQSFKLYWNAFLNNCDYFKQNKVSWFMHTWSDVEQGLGLIDNNGNAKMDFYPKRC